MNADREDGREKEQEGEGVDEVINSTSFSAELRDLHTLQLANESWVRIGNGHAWLFWVFFFPVHISKKGIMVVEKGLFVSDGVEHLAGKGGRGSYAVNLVLVFGYRYR